jgi:hypothetical protein
MQIRRHLQRGRYLAAASETFDEPSRGSAETGFIEQRRVQQVRQSTSVRNGTIDQSLSVTKVHCRAILLSGGENVEIDFGGCEILPEAVVKFAGDAAALFILNSYQSRRKNAQGFGALLDLGFEHVVSTPKGLFGGFSLAQVIANFKLALACRQCRADGADQGCGT